MQVSTNGYLSFGQRINDYSSTLFPHEHSFLVAPYWADIVVRGGVGAISYEVHTTRNGESASLLLSLVNQFVSHHQRTNFTGDWMLIAEWNQVPAFQVNLARVSYFEMNHFYVVDTSLHFVQTNTFQGVVVSDGSRSYAVFIYRCGLMEWNGRAIIGFNANGSLYQNHRLAGTFSAKNIACLNSPDAIWSNVVYLLFVRGMWACSCLYIIISLLWTQYYQWYSVIEIFCTATQAVLLTGLSLHTYRHAVSECRNNCWCIKSLPPLSEWWLFSGNQYPREIPLWQQ